MKEKYWKILLQRWRDKGNKGLTIPYIIGSQKYLPETHQKQNIRELILDIVNNAAPAIYITYCTDIRDLILGVRDTTKESISGYFPSYNSSKQTGFFVTKIADDLGNTIEENIAKLNEDYEDYISKGEVSKNANGRGGYSYDDIAFINSSFEDFFLIN